VDLVVIRFDDQVSVFFGRCHHRGALLADGYIEGSNLICGLHNWDYRYDSGISEYNNAERLQRFSVWVQDGQVLVDEDEIAAWAKENPQPYDRDAYQGAFQEVHGTPEEPYVGYIRQLAESGLTQTGSHGAMGAMGVPRQELPSWDDLQFITAQLNKLPQLDDVPVGTELVVGPRAAKPLHLELPIFVSDMSFGALSEEAKVALARGAEIAGTGIARVKVECYRKSGKKIVTISTNWPPAGSAFHSRNSSRSRPFILKAARAPKPGPAGTFPGTKLKGKLP
jgi:nitrite reductase/ring-hydroxylating ferredoxin subunit